MISGVVMAVVSIILRVTYEPAERMSVGNQTAIEFSRSLAIMGIFFVLLGLVCISATARAAYWEAGADRRKIQLALTREKAKDYDASIILWEELGEIDEAARVRKLKADLAAPKPEIHGDYVDDRNTIVRDSVISKSNIGAGGKSKSEELRDAKALLDDGIIDDDEFKQMKKEILGK